jgi:antitoxin CptB
MYQEAGIFYSQVQPTDRRRLRWRARRGLLENDLFMQRFFNRYGDALTDAQVQGLSELLELPDNELLDLLMGRKDLVTLGDKAASSQAQAVLMQLRCA